MTVSGPLPTTEAPQEEQKAHIQDNLSEGLPAESDDGLSLALHDAFFSTEGRNLMGYELWNAMAEAFRPYIAARVAGLLSETADLRAEKAMLEESMAVERRIHATKEGSARTCPKCRHASHDAVCYNMASDNDCACTFDSLTVAGLRVENEQLRADRDDWRNAAQAAKGHYEQSDARLDAARDKWMAALDLNAANRDRADAAVAELDDLKERIKTFCDTAEQRTAARSEPGDPLTPLVHVSTVRASLLGADKGENEK